MTHEGRRMAEALLLALGMGAALALPSTGYGQSASTGYMPANPQACKVWVPAALHAPDFIPQYTGMCKNGLASGKGRLEWLNRYASMRVTAVWDGYFANGVYAGTAPFDFVIEPQPNAGDYVVRLGAVSGGDVVVFPSNTHDGQMDLCGTSMLGVVLNSRTPAADDTAVRTAMTDAALKLAQRCPTTPRAFVQVNAYAQPFSIDAHGQHTASVAVARLDWSTRALSSYSNQASAEVRAKERGADQAAKLQIERNRFDDFSKRNRITAWVTANQLDTNPFKYEGKTVGMIVQLQRMVTRDTALISGSLQDDAGTVQLHGVTPDFPDSDHAVLLAAIVGTREPLARDANKDATFTSLKRLDTAVCTRSSCEEWLEWARGTDRINWGAPYTPSK